MTVLRMPRAGASSEGQTSESFERLSADGHLQGFRVSGICGASAAPRTSEGLREVVNDRVIVQIGGQPPSELVRTIGIELVEKRGEV